MFFPGPLNIFVPGDSAFMLLKCMCDNISTEKKNKLKNRLITLTFHMKSGALEEP